jgi:tetratricopeptide (TPR) repeat protein
MEKAGKLYNQYKYEKALKHLEKAQEVANTADLSDEDTFEFWNLKGCVLDGLKRFEEALECYDKALELDEKMSRRG